MMRSTAYATALLLTFGTWNDQADAAAAPSDPAAAAPDGTSAAKVSGTVSFNQLTAPAGAPAWFVPSWHALLNASLPGYISWTPGVPVYLPQVEVDPDPTGTTESYQPAGSTYTPANAFFKAFGNGRACVTCHAPSSAMGLSLGSIRLRYVSTYGRDPLFAPVDGATCPKNVPGSWVAPPILQGVATEAAAEVTSSTALSTADASTALSSGTALSSAAAPAASTSTAASGAASSGDASSTALPITVSSLARPIPSYGAPAYATILNKGLIRIPLPVPAGAQFTVQVVSDPYGCDTDPLYDQVTNKDGSKSQIVSMYRRPIISASLKFKVNASGVPAGTPAGNIMWDGREPTLASQASDAVLGHAQSPYPPTADEVTQMVNFESGIYTAQITDTAAGTLTDLGALGGPVALSTDAIDTVAAPPTLPGMTLYNAWNPSLTAELLQRASIYRGQAIFTGRTFNIINVAGVNNLQIPGGVVPNPTPGQCSSCHSQINVGAGSFPAGQVDIGIAGDLRKIGGPGPATDLPVLKVSCTGGATTLFNGPTVLVNDLGRAMITGQCADIGRFTIPTLRGLAARAPYFSDGSAPTMADVVAFYNGRFKINLSTQDQADLVSFLNTL